MNYSEQVNYLRDLNKGDQDITGLGKQIAEKFNKNVGTRVQEWAAHNVRISPEMLLDNYETVRNNYANWLNQNGYTSEQQKQIMAEFDSVANDPRQRSWYDVGADSLKQIASGSLNLGAGVAGGLGLDGISTELRNAAQAYDKDQSTATQLYIANAEREYQQHLANGDNSAFAAAKMYINNPQMFSKLAFEQLPQLGVALGGGALLTGVNALAGGGNYRHAIEQAWNSLSDEEVLKRPEIQARLQQGMDLAQARKDAATDYSDNFGGILAGYAIGGIEGLTPLAKLGKGVNKGVAKTVGKEIGINALQGGAEQVNQNIGVGSIDGKTQWNDELGRSMVEEGIGGAIFSVPAGIDAYRNGKADPATTAEKSTQSDIEAIQKTSEQTPQSPQSANAEIERVLNLRERMQNWHNGGEVGDVNDLLPTMMSFADENAKRDFVMQQAFSEVKNIAEKYGVDPNDGAAMKAWLDDYVAKRNHNNPPEIVVDGAQKAASNALEPTALNTALANVEESEHEAYKDKLTRDIANGKAESFIGKKGKYAKFVTDYFNTLNNPVAEAQAQVQPQSQGQVTPVEQGSVQDIAPQPTETTPTLQQSEPQNGNREAYQTSLTAEQIPLYQQFVQELNQAVESENPNQAMQQVQAKYAEHAPAFMNEIARRLSYYEPEAAKAFQSEGIEKGGDVSGQSDNQSEVVKPQDMDSDKRYSLNEDINSPFAKAIDTISRGENVKGYVNVGTTPDVLKMLGLPDVNVTIHGSTFKKVMGGKHQITPETMKQLPKQINNPIAVMSSATENNGYVVLTELVENENGRDKPVIAALHLKQDANGVELLNIASVYGRSNTQIQRGLNNDLLYWNKSKGTQFISTFGLQLPAYADTNSPLSFRNIKTESDLSQYQNQKTNPDNFNPQIQKDRETLLKSLGKETADKVEIISANTTRPTGENVQSLYADGVEGWFNPKTGKIYLISDSITGDSVFSRDERLVWVAWHELSHAGVNVKFGNAFDGIARIARRNPTVQAVAYRIQKEYLSGKKPKRISETVATEEAIVELSAALKTGRWDAITRRYGINVSAEMRGEQGAIAKTIRYFADALRRLMNKLTGKNYNRTSDADMLKLLKQVREGVNEYGGDSQDGNRSRYSFAGKNAKTANHSLLAKAEAMEQDGKTAETIWKETGWARGVDGQWRFEIDDSQIQLMPKFAQEEIGNVIDPNFEGKTVKLGELLNAPALFAAYPDLSDLSVNAKGLNGSFYSPNKDEIALNGSRKGDELKSTLLHEIQHAIQERENFNRGGSTSDDFTSPIKRQLMMNAQKELEKFDDIYHSSHHLFAQSEEASLKLREYVAFDAVQKLRQMANSDSITRVKKHIFNNARLVDNLLGDIRSGRLRVSQSVRERLSESSRQMYRLPNSNQKGFKQALQEFAFDTAMAIESAIRSESLADFKSDTRTTRAINAALTRAYHKTQKALQPVRNAEQKAQRNEVLAQSHTLSSAYDIYMALAGEVEARNVQTRMNMSAEERRAKSPESTEDMERSRQINVLPNNNNSWGVQSYSLNESTDSEFAKAVDDVTNGRPTKQSIINVGTTPDVLKMLGIDEANVIIHARTLQKDMLGKHSVSAEAMKQLPKQMNNPVAVMRSQSNSTNPNAYLVLTELLEHENGKDKPIIAALDFKRNKNGDLELINIASAYGRRIGQLNRDLSNVMYWNMQKGEQLINNFSLLAADETAALRSSLLSADRLSSMDIKTETDLSQYRSKKSVRQSRRPKSESLEKLRKSETIRISGKEIEPSDDLRQYKRNALAYGKNLRGSYVNEDTGRVIELGASGVKEVLQHDYKNPDHLQSIAAIPKIIEQAIYIDTLPNEEIGKNFSIDEYEYYLAGLNIGGEDYTVKAVIGVSKDGDRYYDHKLTEIEKGELLSLPSRITNPVGESGTPLSEIDDKRLLQILQDGEQKKTDENRYSRKKSALDIANAQQVRNHDETFLKHLFSGNWQAVKKDVAGFGAKLDEWITDSNRPVIDWINAMSGVSRAEKAKLIGRMQRATGVRDAVANDLEVRFLNPIKQDIAKIAKDHFNGDVETAMNKVGYWISARWAMEKNQQLLNRDEQAMIRTEKAWNDAIDNNEPADVIDRLENAFIKAENEFYNRKADVESRDFANDRKYKVGVAGGWSNPLAAEIMRVMENQIPRNVLEAAAERVYDLNQAQLEYNLQSGRYSQAQYDFYIKDRHYVPLTGDIGRTAIDPDLEENSDTGDFFQMPSNKAVNTAKDKALKGRVLSEADNAITAVWESVAKTSTYTGWADFKHGLNDVYETQFHAAKESGMSDSDAHKEAERLTGISKQEMQKGTRSNDNVLIRKEKRVYYEYRIPDAAINALQGSNEEYSNFLFNMIAKPTRWYAKGVTQFTGTFAFTNYMRDTWEKSEFLRVQEIFDAQGKPLSDKQKGAIARKMIKNATLDKETWTATKRYGFKQGLRDSAESERLLKQLIKDGGLSTHGTYLERTEKDLLDKIKRENSALGKRLDKALELVEGYNATFDTVSALATYKALIQSNIDAEQAAAITLELTNFRKTGSKLKVVKGLYMFAQPTAMGGRNLIKYLSTPLGRKRFLWYTVAMVGLYSALRALGDEDEGGNVIDQLGDIDRFIPFPIPGRVREFLKIPVGFGMPQMAWSFATNLVKGAAGDITFTEAATNMAMHTVKATVPVSPSEISAAKHPLAKLGVTVTPSIFQPLTQIAVNRNAFGSQITTGFVTDKKLKAEQSKATTAQFWKDTALWLNDTFGIDMHPEQIKNIADGYSGAFGSLREILTIMIENPNRERLDRNKRVPFLNTFYGAGNEFAIQSRYYQAAEEAQTLANNYNSRKERGTLPDGWLTDERKRILRWRDNSEKAIQTLRSEKAKHTKLYRDGKIGELAYQRKVNEIDVKMGKVQAAYLHQWRRIHGLNTTKTQ